jgi:hypothetical protein
MLQLVRVTRCAGEGEGEGEGKGEGKGAVHRQRSDRAHAQVHAADLQEVNAHVWPTAGIVYRAMEGPHGALQGRKVGTVSTAANATRISRPRPTDRACLVTASTWFALGIAPFRHARALLSASGSSSGSASVSAVSAVSAL